MSKDYSLWAEAKTKHGLAADEVVSGLQKAIRRSMTELACRYAYELYTTSPVLLEKVWSRLMSISVEDIGFGNLVSAGRVVAVVSPDSAPVKRLVKEARERGMLIDASYGRSTRAVLIMDSDHVVLSALTPETVASRAAGQPEGKPTEEQ